MSRTVHAACLAIALLGCTTPATKQPGSTARAGSGSAAEDVVCHEESSTGTMFTHTVCRPKDDDQSDNNDAQRALQRPHTAAPPPAGGH